MAHRRTHTRVLEKRGTPRAKIRKKGFRGRLPRMGNHRQRIRILSGRKREVEEWQKKARLKRPSSQQRYVSCGREQGRVENTVNSEPEAQPESLRDEITIQKTIIAQSPTPLNHLESASVSAIFRHRRAASLKTGSNLVLNTMSAGSYPPAKKKRREGLARRESVLGAGWQRKGIQPV